MINPIVGLMNSGKTLYMTMKLFLAYCKGKTILTNYDLNFPHYKINKDWLIDLSQKEDLALNNVAIGLDEFWIWMDARSAMKNTVFSYFFLQSSKDDTEIYMTAQNNNQIDIRIRNNMHKITQCSRVILQNNEFQTLSEEQRFLPKEYEDKLYIKAIEFKMINIGMYSELIPVSHQFIKANLIFPLYDTRQKIVRKE